MNDGGPFYRSVRTHTVRGVLLVCVLFIHTHISNVYARGIDKKKQKSGDLFIGAINFCARQITSYMRIFLQSLKASAYLKYWFCITFNTRNSQLCHFWEKEIGRRRIPHLSRTPLICRSALRSTFKCLLYLRIELQIYGDMLSLLAAYSKFCYYIYGRNIKMSLKHILAISHNK